MTWANTRSGAGIDDLHPAVLAIGLAREHQASALAQNVDIRTGRFLVLMRAAAIAILSEENTALNGG